MGQTVAEQRAADEQAAMKAQLLAQRVEIATRLEAIDTKLAAIDDDAFMSDLGRKELAQMTTHEKARLVEKLGSAKFEELLLGRR